MILIVDDEPSITSALEVVFSAEGYQTITAHNGEDALEKMMLAPKLVVLDLMLPDMSGYDVCRNIRDLPDYTPVLMLTAKDTLDDKITGLDTGADAYLTKPYHPRELLAQARALLRLNAQADTAVLQCGEIALRLDEGICEISDETVTVTAKEFELLRLFMSSPGQVFGRETILRKIWGYDAYDVTVRTVDTHIQRLRAKIEKDPKTPAYLLTVRGFGYRFVCEEAPVGR